MNPWRWRSDLRKQPHWWPQDEPWPPRSSRYWGGRRRDRFVRRTGWYTFWPVWAMLWLAFTIVQGRFELGPWRNVPRGTTWAPANLIPILLMCAVAAGVVAVIIRRIAGPVADIVGAAERIARRDYRVRVDEPVSGPRWVSDTARAFNAMAAELDAQDVARRHLMADIAHELRTPLAVVQARLEGVIDGVYPASTEELQGVLDNARVLSRLVEDLRTLSNAESGALALAKEPTDILALADDVASSLADRAEPAGVTLRVDADSAPDLEPITIDPIRIREVLLNLVSNALRYTPRDGRVTIKIAASTGGVQIDVIDTGEGIPADEIPRIFDRFYKGAGSSGSGLGLTIARRLVEAHGGTIRAASQPGVGTTMTFTLPA
jgi:two-component system OmpR family sensor kinase/two-component system sensor histidine kinase BaeS